MALTEKDITEAALGILDEYGLADLTMRRLAEALTVKPGAIYWHVANKQTLLARLITAVLDGLTEPSGPWRTGLVSWADELRARLLAHRDSADLLATMRAIGLAATDLTDGPAACLTAAGLTAEQAELGAHTLVHFIIGHVNEEQQRAQLAPLAADGTPPGPQGPAGPGFRAGVQLILDGIGTQLSAGNQADSPTE